MQMNRFRPRRALDRVLREYDVALVIAGSPALCEPLSGGSIPVVLQVATFVKEERREIEGPFWSPRGLMRRLWTTLVSRMDERGLRVPDLVIVENKWMYEQCSGRGVTVALQPPGIDIQLFRPSQPERSGSGYVLSVGRLHDPRKDIGLLVRAFARARKLGLPQGLVLAGRRPPPDDILAFIQDQGLSGVVRLVINPTQDELIRLFQGADFFVLPSKEEGLGVVLVEALACGVPVIATATKGAETVVTDDVGRLLAFGPALEQHMTGAIMEFASAQGNLEQRRRAARRRAVEEFSADTAGKVFASAVERVATRPGGRK
jgi:glycosyltransferase involved in cell wall biosynthesis